MLKNIRKNKKGFTLVEMVVVLVIIAILATLGIAALTGYIDKANEKTALSEGRSCVLALQTELADKYNTGLSAAAFPGADVTSAQIEKLTGLSAAEVANFTAAYDKDTGKIESATYTKAGKYVVTYNGTAGSLTVTTN